MKPAEAIAKYNDFCAECKQYENAEARSTKCPVCIIEIGRNASINENQQFLFDQSIKKLAAEENRLTVAASELYKNMCGGFWNE